MDVLRVKGSGWDLGDIEPEGLPAVRMAPLLALRRLNSLSDEGMVAAQRTAMLDPAGPNPFGGDFASRLDPSDGGGS